MTIAAPRNDPRSLRSWQYRIFGLLWTGYASFYLCRVNFAVAQPSLLADFPDWTSADAGAIPSVYMACYALGQMVNGQFSQRLGARKTMTTSLVIAALVNLAFSQTSNYGVMLALWGLNGYVQSTGWALVVATLTNWTSVTHRGTVVGLISTCYSVGNVVGWLLAGSLVDAYGWRAAFWGPTLIALPVAAVFVFGLRNEPTDAGFAPVRNDLGASGNTDGGPMRELSVAEVLRLTLSNRILWILGIGFFCNNSVRYSFMNWAIQYMADFHQQSVKDSALTAVALPLVGAAGAVFAGWLSDAAFGKRRAPVCAIMLAVLAGVCALFVQVPQGQWMLATGMLAFAGFLIYGPDMLMSGAATVDFSHPKAAAAATSFTMALGALGAIFSGWGVGKLRDSMQGEWALVFYVLAGLALVPAALMVSIWNARPKGAA